MLILVIIHEAHRFPVFEHFLYKFSTLLTSINIQVKLKILVSFYQVAITLKSVYGLQIHSTFTSCFIFLEMFDFGLAELLSIPGSCYGSMKTRLYISAGWPYALVLLLVGGIFSYTSIVDIRIRKLNKKEAMTRCVSHSLHCRQFVDISLMP